jgi:hypothetical protein
MRLADLPWKENHYWRTAWVGDLLVQEATANNQINQGYWIYHVSDPDKAFVLEGGDAFTAQCLLYNLLGNSPVT